MARNAPEIMLSDPDEIVSFFRWLAKILQNKCNLYVIYIRVSVDLLIFMSNPQGIKGYLNKEGINKDVSTFPDLVKQDRTVGTRIPHKIQNFSVLQPIF